LRINYVEIKEVRTVRSGVEELPSILDQLRSRGFEIEESYNASSLLENKFQAANLEINAVLSQFTISVGELVQGGGGEASQTQRLRRQLSNLGWTKRRFVVSRLIDGIESQSQSHEIDHVKEFPEIPRRFPPNPTIALEIEWNNKDPFYNRDLEAFSRLHAEGVISLGIIITRGASIQANLRNLILEHAVVNEFVGYDDLERQPTDAQKRAIKKLVDQGHTFPEAWSSIFARDKYGSATTHYAKLMDRMERGVGSPCPVLAIGLPIDIITG
jgi:hypothetical protein